MTKANNCCPRCGQTLNLVDEEFAEFQAVEDQNHNQVCLQCYQDLNDERC